LFFGNGILTVFWSNIFAARFSARLSFFAQLQTEASKFKVRRSVVAEEASKQQAIAGSRQQQGFSFTLLVF